MRAWGMPSRLLLLALLLACGPESSPVRAPAEAPPEAPAPSEEPAVHGEGEEQDGEDAPGPEGAVGPDDAPHAYDERSLDAMDHAALEAACMQGSTAACDRLGH